MDDARHQQFAERVVRNQHRVFGYIVSLVPHRADAEEIFQQTCLTLWENWDRYDSALDFFPWACGIAHNHVRNFCRKQQKSPVQLDADVIDMLAQRSAELQQRGDDRISALRDCLQLLPDRSRALIEDYYGGTAVQQIALQSKATPNAIYKLLNRIRDTLHDCISRKLSMEAAS
jgi:RNA polymerase sigma-70 factor (ECF subfamily)